jgi:hypothetical protein
LRPDGADRRRDAATGFPHGLERAVDPFVADPGARRQERRSARRGTTATVTLPAAASPSTLPLAVLADPG